LSVRTSPWRVSIFGLMVAIGGVRSCAQRRETYVPTIGRMARELTRRRKRRIWAKPLEEVDEGGWVAFVLSFRLIKCQACSSGDSDVWVGVIISAPVSVIARISSRRIPNFPYW